jgi:hypothetical protein
MLYSLESSLSSSLIARFFSVSFSRFAGSLSGFRFRASLHRISKQNAFVKRFWALFSEKNQANQRFRTMPPPQAVMFGFWAFPASCECPNVQQLKTGTVRTMNRTVRRALSGMRSVMIVIDPIDRC